MIIAVIGNFDPPPHVYALAEQVGAELARRGLPWFAAGCPAEWQRLGTNTVRPCVLPGGIIAGTGGDWVMTVEVPLALIIALAAANSGAVVALMGVVVFLAFRVGRLPTREDHNELRNELKADNAQFREEFRRSHQQIMLALVNHSHREDGQAMFTLPPEMEITPAPADD